MIPHSLHNKEYFWSYDEKYDIFSYYFLCFFSNFNRKYLKLIKMDISVFEFKLFIYTQNVTPRLRFDTFTCEMMCYIVVGLLVIESLAWLESRLPSTWFIHMHQIYFEIYTLWLGGANLCFISINSTFFKSHALTYYTPTNASQISTGVMLSTVSLMYCSK